MAIKVKRMGGVEYCTCNLKGDNKKDEKQLGLNFDFVFWYLVFPPHFVCVPNVFPPSSP